jgi:hypothetical protein
VLSVAVPAFGSFPVLVDPSPDIGVTIGCAVHPSAPMTSRNVAGLARQMLPRDPSPDHGKLLVVDDAPFLRGVMAASLRLLGFTVH